MPPTITAAAKRPSGSRTTGSRRAAERLVPDDSVGLVEWWGGPLSLQEPELAVGNPVLVLCSTLRRAALSLSSLSLAAPWLRKARKIAGLRAMRAAIPMGLQGSLGSCKIRYPLLHRTTSARTAWKRSKRP